MNNYYTPTTQFGRKADDDEDELDYTEAEVSVPGAYRGTELDVSPETKAAVDARLADVGDQRIAPLDANGLQAAPAGEDGVVPEDTRTEAQRIAGEQERLREQYLARYEQAKADASASSIQGKDGYQYAPQTSDTDKWKQTLLTGAAALFMVGMPAAGIAAAAMTWLGASDRQHREKQIRHLEDKGYAGKDIQAWVDSGDHRFLAEDTNNRYLNTSLGVFDKTTGEYVQNASGNAGLGKKDVDWAEVTMPDGRKAVVALQNGVAVDGPDHGMKVIRWSSLKADKDKGGDGGSAYTGGGEDTDIFQDENGEYWQRQYDTKGNAKPPKHLPNYRKTLDAKTPDLTRTDTDYGVSWQDENGYTPDLNDAPDDIFKTEGERKHARFIREGSLAEKQYREATEDGEGYDPTQWAAYISGKGKFPELLKSDDRRKMEAAQDRFLNAVLRLDTGAAYTVLEQYDTKNLFPKAGDSKAVVEQKRQMREEILQGIAQGTGKGRKYSQNTIQKTLSSEKSKKKDSPKADTSVADKRGKEFDQTSKQAKNKPEAKTAAEEFPNYSGVREYKGWLIGRNKETGKVEKLRPVK